MTACNVASSSSAPDRTPSPSGVASARVHSAAKARLGGVRVRVRGRVRVLVRVRVGVRVRIRVRVRVRVRVSVSGGVSARTHSAAKARLGGG